MTNIKNCDRYESLNPAFARLFAFIKNADFDKLPEGRIEIDGDALFVNNVHPDGKDKEEQHLEIHRKYIDVHFLISGTEAYIDLIPGEMAIVWPEDAHAPAISDGKLHKIIAKVLV